MNFFWLCMLLLKQTMIRGASSYMLFMGQLRMLFIIGLFVSYLGKRYNLLFC